MMKANGSMNYVEWCELVLRVMGTASEESAQVRNQGIDQDSLARLIWQDSYVEIAQHLKSNEGADIIYDVIFDLYKTLLIDNPNETFFKLTREGRAAAKDIFPIWANACLIRLDSLSESALRIINKHSELPGQHFARVVQVPMNAVHCELADDEMTEEDVWELLRELKALGLAYWDGGLEPEEVQATYNGLLWENRRDQVMGAEFIDRLVNEWETTSVEFKRELRLDTADQKAEFIKDVIGLTNTQASGRRWLIVGFDDKTHAYHSLPDPNVTQNRIETILARYTTPSIEVRYETPIYKGGQVGKLEILREAKKLPHRVAKSLGQKKRIRLDQIFVRHGSQTEEPTSAELEAIHDEAERARKLHVSDE
ncbi:MAG TPA: ATP-binding protein [Pyrinomonadaceae bacterium]|jgi:hypothetical protein|nr:ATP-binding protein [Pyrinomonadaceae bacterium]